MIGLIGSHRTGKTTLARAYSEARGCDFVQTSTTAVFQRLGLSPKIDYSFSVRLAIQMEVLADLDAAYTKSNYRAITDRTPLDALAYTMADIQRSNLNASDIKAFTKYRKACIKMTNDRLHSILLIQPGIPLVEEPGKAPANIAYMDHLNTIMKGLLLEPDLLINILTIRPDVIDLDHRIKAVDRLMNRGIERVQLERAHAGFEGTTH